MQLGRIPFLLCFIVLFSSNIDNLSMINAATVVEEEVVYSKFDPSDIELTVYSYFIKQLENFEFTVDLDASQIFPNDEIKQDIVSKYRPAEYNITNLNYELLGFRIFASDIEIHVDPKKIDITKTRIDIPVMLAKNVKVGNGVINLDFNKIDLGSIYAIYDRNTDKIGVHVPMNIAYRYLQQ
jgi:hypothetical protein